MRAAKALGLAIGTALVRSAIQADGDATLLIRTFALAVRDASLGLVMPCRCLFSEVCIMGASWVHVQLVLSKYVPICNVHLF